MQAAQRLPGAQAKAAGCALLVGGDALHGSLDRIETHRHEAYGQGHNHDRQRALEEGQRRESQALRPGQQLVIQPGNRHKQTDRQQHAREGIAQVGKAHQRSHPALPLLAFGRSLRIGQRQRCAQHHQRGQARKHQRIQQVPPVTQVQVGGCQSHHPEQQLQHRRDKRGCQHQQAASCGGPGRRSGQDNPRAPLPLGGRTELATCARALLQPHQRQHAQSQQRSQLRGHRQIEHPQPGLVDRGGEGIDVENGHGAKVCQYLHQGQADACCPPWPRHRNSHAPERLSAAQTQRLRRLQALLALGLKSLPCQQIHIGVQRQAEHHHRPAGGAHRRQAAGQAGRRAPQGLHRAAVFHQAHMDERQHIGRQSKRQHQGPTKPASARKLAHHRDPGQRHAQQRHPEPDKHRQDQRIEQHPGQHIVAQMLPDFGLAQGPACSHYDQWRDGQQGQGHHHPQRPARQLHARFYL